MQQRFGSLGMVTATQIQKMSLMAKVVCGLILAFYFLSFIPGVQINLAVTPIYIGPPNVKIWTLATATFYESNIIVVILDIFAVIVLSAFLEPLWGPKEFVLFTGIVGVVSLVSGVLASVVGYAITRSYTVMFFSYHGLAPVVCGYIVAVKQLHPDSVPLPPPVPPTLRVKHMPVLLVVVSLLLAIFQMVPFAFFWLVLSGCVVSWTYLRFYQKKEQGRGDMAEGFAFATFFPEAIQPVLATISGFIFHLLVSIKVCPKTVRTYDVGSSSTIKVTMPGADSADAQRRKQRALKALDERLKKSNEPLNWPSLEEGGSSSGPDEASTPSLKPSASSTGQLEAVVVEKTPSKTVSPATSATKLSSTSPSD